MAGARPDGKWEDCGCPLSMTHLDSYKLDSTMRPHVCLVSRDEWRKHYIFDRHAYTRATKAPQGSRLESWVTQRLREARLFVAKAPDRPPLPPEPWRFDEPPPLSGPLAPGWRAWEPSDEALRFDTDWVTPESYDAMVDEFFGILGVDGLTKKLMAEGAETWLLACGTPAPAVKVLRRSPIKNDRVFVTADNEFFSVLVEVLASKTVERTVMKLLATLGLGSRVKHARRWLDVRIDAAVRMGGCGHVFSFI